MSSADYQATVTLRVEASQFMTGIDQVNQKLAQTGQSGTEFATKQTAVGNSLDQTGTKAQTAGQKFQSFSTSMIGMVGSITAISGGLLGIAESYTSMEKAQTTAQRSTDRFNQAKITEQSLQDKVNQMQAKGLTGTEAYNVALQKLTLQHSKVQTAQESATIAQTRAAEAMANFANNILPNVLSIMGSVATMVTTMPGGFDKMKSALSGAGQAFSGLGTSSLLAMGALGAVAIVIALVATNAFGFRDALNAAGKAIGDAIPALQPFLIGIKALGEAVGLTGNDVKQGFTGMNSDTKNFVDTSTQAMKTWVDQMNAMGKDLDAKNYKKFWDDMGTFMTTNFKSNVDGFSAILEGMKANIAGNLKGWVDIFSALGGLIGAALAPIPGIIQGAFGGMASWFVSNVQVPIINAWNSTVGVFNQLIVDPIKQTFAGTAAWFETYVAAPIRATIKALQSLNPASWFGGLGPQAAQAMQAPGAAAPPAPRPVLPPAAPTAPTLSGRGTPQAPFAPTAGIAGGGIQPIAATMTAPSAFTPGRTPLSIGGGAAVTAGIAGGLLPDFAGLSKQEQAATQTALEFARVHHIVIPAAFTGSSAAIKSFIGPMQQEADQYEQNFAKSAAYLRAHNMLTPALEKNKSATIAMAESQKELTTDLGKTAKENQSLGIQWTANAIQLSGASGQQELYTNGMLKQRIALQTMQQQVETNKGSLETYTNQVRGGTILNTAFTLGIQAQQKQLLDDTVALSTNAGKMAELDKQLAAGEAQAVAYASGLQKAHSVTQQMQISTAELQGQIQGTREEFASGTRQAALYQKAVADTGTAYQDTVSKLVDLNTKLTDGTAIINRHNAAVVQAKVNYDQLIISTQDSVTTQQEYDKELDIAIGQSGIFNGILDKTSKNLELVQKAALGDKAALESIQGTVQGLIDWFTKLGDAVSSKLGDALDKGHKDFSKALKDMEKETGIKFDPDAQFSLSVAAAGASAKKVLGADIGAMAAIIQGGGKGIGTATEAMISNLTNSIRGQSPQVIASWQKIFDDMRTIASNPINSPAAEKALGDLKTRMTALGEPTANIDGLIKTLGVNMGTSAKAVDGLGRSLNNATSAMKSFLGAGTGADLSKQAQSFMAGSQQFTGGGLGAAGGGAGPAPAKAPATDMSAAIAQLKNLQTQAQAVMNSIVVMTAGVAAQMNANFAKGTQDAAGMLNQLKTQAQAVLSGIVTLLPPVANALNTQFSKGANDAAGMLNQLKTQAASVISGIIGLLPRVSAALNTQFSKGAQDAAGMLNKLLTQANSVMNGIVSSSGRAATAVASVGAAIARLPNKTVTITANVGSALSNIASVQRAVDSLHGKSITVSVGLSGPGVGFLQHGHHGVIDKPTLFFVGEAGPERVDVTPLSGPTVARHGSVIDRTTATQGNVGFGTGIGGGSSSGGGNAVTIVVNVAGKEVWRELRKVIFEDMSQY